MVRIILYFVFRRVSSTKNEIDKKEIDKNEMRCDFYV